MKITLKHLEDAVPEMIEVEFIYETLMTSIVLSLEEADSVCSALDKMLKKIKPISDAVKYGINEVVFPAVVTLCRAKQKINAIKEIRNAAGTHIDANGNTYSNVSLLDAKNLVDKVSEAITKGEL